MLPPQIQSEDRCGARSFVTSTSAITNAANTPPASCVAPTCWAPRLPRMKSLTDVQVALAEVFSALADKRVPLQRASRILFNLEKAALTLRVPSLSWE